MGSCYQPFSFFLPTLVWGEGGEEEVGSLHAVGGSVAGVISSRGQNLRPEEEGIVLPFITLVSHIWHEMLQDLPRKDYS